MFSFSPTSELRRMLFFLCRSVRGSSGSVSDRESVFAIGVLRMFFDVEGRRMRDRDLFDGTWDATVEVVLLFLLTSEDELPLLLPLSDLVRLLSVLLFGRVLLGCSGSGSQDPRRFSLMSLGMVGCSTVLEVFDAVNTPG